MGKMRPRERPGSGPSSPDNMEDFGEAGMTALMFAAQSGAEACVRRLLLAAANVNAMDEDSWTPLHFAAKEGHLEVCSLLLEGRSDPQLVNCDEQTPLELAEAEDV